MPITVKVPSHLSEDQLTRMIANAIVARDPSIMKRLEFRFADVIPAENWDQED